MCLLLLYVHNIHIMTCFIHLNFLIPPVMELPFCMQICYFKIIQSSETEPILHVMIVCKELSNALQIQMSDTIYNSSIFGGLKTTRHVHNTSLVTFVWLFKI